MTKTNDINSLISEELIELSEDEFAEQYQLLRNHLNPHAGWVDRDGNGRLFETFGAEFEFVTKYPANRIWTLIDGEDGELYIVSGFHFVNRLGYLLSREPFPHKALIQIEIRTATSWRPSLQRS